MTLKGHTLVKPLSVLDEQHTILQLADDTQFFAPEDESALEAVMDTLHTVQSNIGFEINKEKTQLFLFGGAQKPNSCEFPVVDKSPKLLGVDMNKESKQLPEILTKACSILSCWKSCTLTLYGKVNIINTLIG